MSLISINTNPARRLMSPIVRCKIGEDLFECGDQWLMSANASLGEGEKSSRCAFEIYDPLQYFANKYFKASYSQGGLSGLGPQTGNGATTGLTDFNGTGPDASEPAIVAECLRQGIRDKAQIAAILATAQYDSADFSALTESTSGEEYEGKRNLGNTQPGDGPKFKGRGFIKITGRRNYARYSKILGKNFTANPSQMAQPNVAVFTLVHGMKNGTLTGSRLSEYVGGNRRDFAGARKVSKRVPDSTSSNAIAASAQDYLDSGYVDDLIKKVNSQPAPTKSSPSEEKPPIEQADKGAQITVWMGYEPTQLVEFTFIHTGTRFRGMDRNTTSFEGQSARWALTRRLKNATYQQITLKQLAQRVADSYGLTLKMKVDGPKYEFLDQTGITDYKLLQRECDRIGYRLYDEGPNLIIEERKGKPLGFVLEYGVNMDAFEISDSAQTDSGAGSTASQPQTSSSTGELKTVIDPATGIPQQRRKENKAAVGLAKPNQAATTGASKPPIQPKTEKVTDAQDQLRQDAANRVKGFPGSATFTTTDAALAVTPDTPFITEGLQGDFLNRVWVVESVSHDYQGGTLKTTIKFYSPMAPKAGGADGLGGAIGGTNCNERIFNAAKALRGMNTSNGPDGGNNACVFAVNKVLARAGYPSPWGSSNFVPTAEQGLKTSGAKQVSAAQALPGDIVIWDNPAANKGHIGIVTASGAKKVLSNSSSRAAFVWEAPNSSYESFYGVRARIYRVKC